MIKALFIDIDGTLVSFKTHDIPCSTISALEQAHSKGIKIIIATGRPLSIINNLDSISHLIDGYICTNGSHCFVGKNNVYLQPLKQETIDYIFAHCTEHNLPAVVVGVENISVFNFSDEAQRVFWEQIKVDCRGLSRPLDDILKKPLLQLTPFYPIEHEKEYFPNVPDCIITRWHPSFADFSPQGVDKGKGLHKMADYLGFTIDETMGFGDGGNDIPLLIGAGIGVAMGNATDAIKQNADFITTTVDENGIANALRHFGVIE